MIWKNARSYALKVKNMEFYSDEPIDVRTDNDGEGGYFRTQEGDEDD